MRLPNDPLLPQSPDSAYANQLNFSLKALLRALYAQVNGLGDGTLASSNNAAASVPTTGTFAKGDFVRNSNPSELGTTPNKYVVEGWICLVGGTPGTFVQKRFLTGN